MTNDEILGCVRTAQAALRLVEAGLQPTVPTSAVITVHAGQSVQAAVDTAPAGATLALEPGTYEGTVRLTKPITIQASAWPTGRATAAGSGVWLTSPDVDGTVLITGPDVSLIGLGVKNANPDAEIVVIQPAARNTVLDGLTVLGDPVKGQRRGIRAEGTGMQILRSYVGEIWRVGVETQAIGCSVGCRDLLIDDCYLEGASQAFMAGGSDSGTPDAMPQHITIKNSTLTKQLRWYALKAQIKNALELKACSGFTMQDCILEYAGISGGQGSYLIVLTPRNQEGGAPWSRVEDVVIERIHGQHAGGCISLLGMDDSNPSGPCRRIRISHALFTDITPKGIWKGDGRGLFLNNGPQDVTLEHLEIQAANMGAACYLGGTPPTKLVMRDVTLPQATYGVKIDGGGMDSYPYTDLKTLKAYAPDALLELARTTGPVGVPS